MTNESRQILITGAEGMIGSILRQGLSGDFQIVPLTRTPQSYPSRVVDITQLDPLAAAFQGIDAVIHLAGAAALDAPWDDVLANSIVGTRNVFEAARAAGVSSVIFASSGHVLGMAEEELAPAFYELHDSRCFDHRTELRPDSLYAVAKIFGESLGRYYADVFGLRVICLRLGTVLPDDNPLSVVSAGRGRSAALPAEQRRLRVRAKWLSHRDCCQLFARCLDATNASTGASARWAVVFGTSRNPRQIWSLDETRRLLGYAPQDSAPV